jgi:ABC-type uncharacterized transport system auxiliary subunit
VSRARSMGLAACALATSGCSGGLFQSHVVAPIVYQLRAPAVAAAPARVAATLVVARPRAGPGLESDRIVVTLPDRRIDVYAGSRWSAPLPDLVESLLLDGLRSSGGWEAVVSERSEFPGRYLLQTEIREFAADYASGRGPPTVRVTLHGEFGSRAGQRFGASVAGHAEVTAGADRQREVVAAFEAAYGQAAALLIAAVQAAALEAVPPPGARAP